MRIGILNSGGDCPGLNAVIHGAVCAAEHLGWDVVGFHDGYEGLLYEDWHEELTSKRTDGIVSQGGSILGTTNKGHFVAKVGKGDVAKIPEDVISKARATFDRLGLDGLISVGGDGSLTTAQQLFEEGWPVVGVPKTIDNDLHATSRTFGFDTAVNVVSESIDRLHTTAMSHKRIMVVEVMGRHAGWIGLWGGMAGSASVILLPEIPFDLEKVAAHIRERDARGLRSTMVVVAEGAKFANQHVTQHGAPCAGEIRLGGIGDLVARELEKLTGKEARCAVLGHLQRGGSPSALDRVLGVRFGVMAVELLREKRYGRMVNFLSSEVGSVPILEAVNQLNVVQSTSELVMAARAVGICFGDEKS